MAIKLTAFQKRTAEKYKHLLEAAELRKAFGERNTRKLRSVQAEYTKLIKKSKMVQREFRLAHRRGEHHRLRGLDLEMDNLHSKMFDLKETKYKMELEERISRGYIEVAIKDEDGKATGTRVMSLNLDEPVTPEQQAMIDLAMWRVEGYRFKGDMTMTTFYHKYEFDSISEEAVRIMLIGEDWKL